MVKNCRFLFQQVGAQPHAAKLTLQFMQASGTDSLEPIKRLQTAPILTQWKMEYGKTWLEEYMQEKWVTDVAHLRELIV